MEIFIVCLLVLAGFIFFPKWTAIIIGSVLIASLLPVYGLGALIDGLGIGYKAINTIKVKRGEYALPEYDPGRYDSITLEYVPGFVLGITRKTDKVRYQRRDGKWFSTIKRDPQPTGRFEARRLDRIWASSAYGHNPPS